MIYGPAVQSKGGVPLPVDIIAEIGVNHDGSIDRAKALMVDAMRAGATTVKFQMFRSDEIVSEDAELADYQKENLSSSMSQSAMLRHLELSSEQMAELMSYASELGVEFLCTAFDIDSLHWLMSQGQKRIKIASGEITNYFLLSEIARLNQPVLLSTGMASVDEIEAALDLLLSGNRSAGDITLLQCTSSYPTQLNEANINALAFMRKRFNLEVGFSDHTTSFHSALAAVALGATVIEKHVTYNRDAEGPDHKASADLAEFAEYVHHIRMVEVVLGELNKVPTNSELSTARSARRSLVAAHQVTTGEPFTRENLRARRPGTGISPMEFAKLEGRPSNRNYQPGDLVQLD
jgi:N,N'-diacetyllegionaminate synthase